MLYAGFYEKEVRSVTRSKIESESKIGINLKASFNVRRYSIVIQMFMEIMQAKEFSCKI